jgi:hypothetical protein
MYGIFLKKLFLQFLKTDAWTCMISDIPPPKKSEWTKLDFNEMQHEKLN